MRRPKHLCWNLARILAWIPALGFSVLAVGKWLRPEPEHQDAFAESLDNSFTSILTGLAVMHVAVALLLLWRNAYATGIVIGLFTVPGLLMAVLFPGLLQLVLLVPQYLLYPAGLLAIIVLLIAHEVGQHRRQDDELVDSPAPYGNSGS